MAPWARRGLVPIILLSAAALATYTTFASPSLPQLPLDDDVDPPIVPLVANPPSSIDELRSRIGEVLDREGIPGAAIALVGRDGPIWIGGVGVADRATGQPVDAATVFRVASITKSVVALGVMRLVEQGRLTLDQPVREVVPDAGIDNAWEAAAPVTLAQVLEHTAGFDDMHPNEFDTDDDALTASAALAINPRSRVVRWRPGTRHSYSNVGYTVAARAIEVATGEPFDVWLRREVIVPLGMGGADFHRTDALARHLATGYSDRDRPVPFRPIAHRAAGALLASATDLAQLVRFFLVRTPAIVSPTALDRIERAETLPYGHLDTDYGLGNHGDVSHPARARGHDGGLPGFASSMRYFPDLGLGYVILLNARSSGRAFPEIRELVFAYLVRGKALPVSSATFAATLRPEAEFFGFASPQHSLLGFLDRALFGWHTSMHGEGVRLEPLVGTLPDFVATADGAYRLPRESGSSLRFALGEGNRPVMIWRSVYAESGSWRFARTRLLALELAVLLLQLAPLWAAADGMLAALRGRRWSAFGLSLWPAIAGGCIIALPRLMIAAAARRLLGGCNLWTIAVFATTIAFALAAAAGVVTAIRWSFRRDRPSVWSRLVPTATCVAAAGLALWLGAHGIVGLRTWAW